MCCITAGTCVFSSVLAECSARFGLGERGSPSCLFAVVIGLGTAVAGTKIHRPVWTKKESPPLTEVVVCLFQGKFFSPCSWARRKHTLDVSIAN